MRKRAQGFAPHPHDAAIHEWFGLSYSNYLVLPRSILQEMPVEWQDRFVGMLEEMFKTWDATSEGSPLGVTYEVRVRDKWGVYVRDPLAEYRHPNAALIESLRRRKP